MHDLSSRTTDRRAFLKRSAKLAAGLAAAPCLITPRKARAGDDYLVLFDGKTLAGWHTNRERLGHGTGGRWQVEDGAITGLQDPPGSGNGGILLTDRTFGDFELLVDLRPDWDIDSGLFLRATEQGQCFQMMVDYYDGGNVGHLYGEGTGGFNTRAFSIDGQLDDSGALTGLTTRPYDAYAQHPLPYTCTPEAWVAAWKLGDWNTARVRCTGGAYPTITTWINDVQVMTFDAAAYQHPQYDKEQVARTLGTEGAIALQVHGGTHHWPEDARCRWKNIKVKPL